MVSSNASALSWPHNREIDFSGACENRCTKPIGTEYAIVIHDGPDPSTPYRTTRICPRCLATSLNQRGYGWPRVNGNVHYHRYVYVESRGEGRLPGMERTIVSSPPVVPDDPVLDPIRRCRERVKERHAAEKLAESDGTNRVMLVTISFVGGSGGGSGNGNGNGDGVELSSFSFELDASPDGWQNVTQADVENMCVVARLLSPYVIGLSAHLTPRFTPVQSPREQLLFALEEDNRPAIQFLFSLLTGEHGWDVERIKTNPDFTSQFWACWVAAEALTRTILTHPSYLQNMMNDVMSTQDISKSCRALLSMLNISASGSYTYAAMAEAALQHVMEHTSLPRGAICALAGDNMGLKMKRGFQQWTVLFVMTIKMAVLKKFSLHDDTFSRIEYDTWAEYLENTPEDEVDAIPAITEYDEDSLSAIDLALKRRAGETAQLVLSKRPRLREEIAEAVATKDGLEALTERLARSPAPKRA